MPRRLNEAPAAAAYDPGLLDQCIGTFIWLSLAATVAAALLLTWASWRGRRGEVPALVVLLSMLAVGVLMIATICAMARGLPLNPAAAIATVAGCAAGELALGALLLQARPRVRW